MLLIIAGFMLLSAGIAMMFTGRKPRKTNKESWFHD